MRAMQAIAIVFTLAVGCATAPKPTETVRVRETASLLWDTVDDDGNGLSFVRCDDESHSYVCLELTDAKGGVVGGWALSTEQAQAIARAVSR